MLGNFPHDASSGVLVGFFEGAPSSMSSPGPRPPRRSPWNSALPRPGDAHARPPEPLDSAILLALAGDLVPVALEALDSGGTLSIAGIYLTGIPPLDHERHLFRERSVRSVTATPARTDGTSSPRRPATGSGPR
ncbi:hypothetical protein J7E88_27125 [Streptomyces sp. ISL-10]|uniref:hypothetical protein n=1 Tax=Streptomyces sp. ISL-10 TaxID=2819172 RepID=UPI001BECA30E|nr:hypothetical protein [Streptomyces sp. ISL-10]MBT2368890.1 hypothetical protein [Streptomyces sp. ISL-10]